MMSAKYLSTEALASPRARTDAYVITARMAGEGRAGIAGWSDDVQVKRLYEDIDEWKWFVQVCAEAGIGPATSTLFDYLEADDRVNFPVS